MKKRERLFFIGNFQLLQFINVIIFALYHIFWISFYLMNHLFQTSALFDNMR